MDTYLTADLVYKRINSLIGNRDIEYFFLSNRVMNINRNEFGKYVLLFQNRNYTIVGKNELIKVVTK